MKQEWSSAGWGRNPLLISIKALEVEPPVSIHVPEICLLVFVFRKFILIFIPNGCDKELQIQYNLV